MGWWKNDPLECDDPEVWDLGSANEDERLTKEQEAKLAA